MPSFIPSHSFHQSSSNEHKYFQHNHSILLRYPRVVAFSRIDIDIQMILDYDVARLVRLYTGPEQITLLFCSLRRYQFRFPNHHGHIRLEISV